MDNPTHSEASMPSTSSRSKSSSKPIEKKKKKKAASAQVPAEKHQSRDLGSTVTFSPHPVTMTLKTVASPLSEAHGVKGAQPSTHLGAQSPTATQEDNWVERFAEQAAITHEIPNSPMMSMGLPPGQLVLDTDMTTLGLNPLAHLQTVQAASMSSAPTRYKVKEQSHSAPRRQTADHRSSVSPHRARKRVRAETPDSTSSTSPSPRCRKSKRHRAKRHRRRDAVIPLDTHQQDLAGTIDLPTKSTASATQQAQLPDSPATMDEESEMEADSQASHHSTLSKSRHSEVEMTDTQPATLIEDFKHYSQMLHKIAQVMGLQVQLLATNRAKEAWTKPSSNPLIPRRIDNFYKTHGEGTDFLMKHPLPNSVIVDANQNRGRSHSNTTLSNKEARKLDLVGRRHYSMASFSLRALSYLCAMEAYTRHILLTFPAFIDLLPEEHKVKAQVSYSEVLSLIDYQMITSLHLTDAASKQLTTAIHLRCHAWLRMANITDDARNRIEDSPFDGEGLFATSTDASLDNIQKMHKAAKSYTYQGTASQSTSRPPSRPGGVRIHLYTKDLRACTGHNTISLLPAPCSTTSPMATTID
ncbi:hypothetical protein JRQ81_016063 [Phrynocephalus forsythii]|uniref:Uncharacterized protein n=1 Tax=Phrynocephalus forsythii TaxID=171643 RepID=A0A9Q0XW60_9SAUR|nr:hypothetical protein JRQ81_016063 [Phrynocephalus forsythii]